MASDSDLSNNQHAIPLLRNSQGWKTFRALFLAKLGAKLKAVLQDAEQAAVKGKVAPATIKQKDEFSTISDRLLVALQNHSDLVNFLCEDCDVDNGPECFLALQQKLAGNTVANDLIALTKIMQSSIGADDPVAEARAIVALNNSISSTHKLSDNLLAAFIVCKLPAFASSLRSIFIERDALPSTVEVIDKLEQQHEFRMATTPSTEFDKLSFFTKGKYQGLCFNCDAKDEHATHDCPKPPAGCEYCGDTAKHLSRYCFVPNDRPLPRKWSQDRKAEMEARRKEFKAKNNKPAAQVQHANTSIDIRRIFEEQEMGRMSSI
jgi:hypothetical protein